MAESNPTADNSDDSTQRRWDQLMARLEGPHSPPARPSVETTQAGPPSVRRVNVNFSNQAYQTLEHLARSTGKSMSDVLRDAIALKVWFEQTRAEGGHVLVERPDGKIREVISV